MIHPDILLYTTHLSGEDADIADMLSRIIDTYLVNSQNKVRHAHPVWFLEGNPIVGYSKEKKGMRLMFWSGKDFFEEQLSVQGGKFRDASVFYNNTSDINQDDIVRWLHKAKTIQWDYKNIVKRKGKLEKLTDF